MTTKLEGEGDGKALVVGLLVEELFLQLPLATLNRHHLCYIQRQIRTNLYKYNFYNRVYTCFVVKSILRK